MADRLAPEPQPALATRLREEAAIARAQDPGKPARVPPGNWVFLSPELAEALAEVLEAAADFAYEDGATDDDDLANALEAAEALAR